MSLEFQQNQLAMTIESYKREVERRTMLEENLVLAQNDLERRVWGRTEELKEINRAMAE